MLNLAIGWKSEDANRVPYQSEDSAKETWRSQAMYSHQAFALLTTAGPRLALAPARLSTRSAGPLLAHLGRHDSAALRPRHLPPGMAQRSGSADPGQPAMAGVANGNQRRPIAARIGCFTGASTRIQRWRMARQDPDAGRRPPRVAGCAMVVKLAGTCGPHRTPATIGAGDVDAQAAASLRTRCASAISNDYTASDVPWTKLHRQKNRRSVARRRADPAPPPELNSSAELPNQLRFADGTAHVGNHHSPAQGENTGIP